MLKRRLTEQLIYGISSSDDTTTELLVGVLAGDKNIMLQTVHLVT